MNHSAPWLEGQQQHSNLQTASSTFELCQDRLSRTKQKEKPAKKKSHKQQSYLLKIDDVLLQSQLVRKAKATDKPPQLNIKS